MYTGETLLVHLTECQSSWCLSLQVRVYLGAGTMFHNANHSEIAQLSTLKQYTTRVNKRTLNRLFGLHKRDAGEQI